VLLALSVLSRGHFKVMKFNSIRTKISVTHQSLTSYKLQVERGFTRERTERAQPSIGPANKAISELADAELPGQSMRLHAPRASVV